eukprot:TRINITY_DN5179_c0_g1_i2.p2 TRINITY_DN5179_c0_g1~~TRINITY_DN5179_c0_g1_i2.p2  ORF type:complete len:381 (-),score=38.78 TRINITY_DN5179_c0_g1_i2:1373-2515(-)
MTEPLESDSRKRTADHLDDPPQPPAKKQKMTPIRTGMHPELVESLTPYDVNRKPRPSIEDDKSVTFAANHLLPEFRCPLCEGALVKTMTAMECLHRFCNDCISKYIRIGRKECPVCFVKLSSMRVLRPDVAFDGMIQTIFPPQVRAMPLVRREANLDRKIQLSHHEEEREDEYVGLDDEMSPRKGITKRGTPSKRGRGGKATSVTSHAPLAPSPVAAPASPSPPPRSQSPPPAPAVSDKPLVNSSGSFALNSPKSQKSMDKQPKSAPKRARPKRNPDSDRVVLILKSLLPSSQPLPHSFLITPARTTVASLKEYISLHVHESPADSETRANIVVTVATGSGSKESLPDDFALGSVASRSAETASEGYPVVYFQFQKPNTT